MKKFALRVLIILGITFLLDRGISYGVKYFYKTTTTTNEYKINQVIDVMTEPVIFMGSSRAHHHYIPAIIQDTLKTGVYNAGLWGMRNIYFQYGFLSAILERYTPKTIVLELHPTDYLKTPFSTPEAAGPLITYLNYSKGSDEVLKLAGLYYKGQVSHLYRYNGEFANLLAGNFSQRSLASDKGFKAINGKLNTTLEIKPERFPFSIDKEKVQYLQSFINLCREHNIKLIFIFSPMYATEKTTLFNLPNAIAKKNNLIFINHYNMPGITGHSEYFYDFGHLNEVGAQKYSSIIASELKKYMK
ncbi:hypothetical protein [Pedobacter sp.]|uniref:hypothetical protein n=1 Tax=Pedobacter sp. TaxID=1411316 RepID=UPI003BACC071